MIDAMGNIINYGLAFVAILLLLAIGAGILELVVEAFKAANEYYNNHKVLVNIAGLIIIMLVVFSYVVFAPNTPKRIVDAKQPEQQEPMAVQEPVKQQELFKFLQRNWGNGIITTVTIDPCPSTMLTNEGYSYALFSSIPLSRLKLQSDAYSISGDRAVTVVGCWIKKEGNLIHAKMKRKKDGKTWEQDFKMDDGNWTAK